LAHERLQQEIESIRVAFHGLMGSDQYQLHSAEAILRFWALGLCLYQYLDSLRHRLKKMYQQDFTLGETLNWLRERNTQLLLKWIWLQVNDGATVQQILEYSAPALPVSSVNY